MGQDLECNCSSKNLYQKSLFALHTFQHAIPKYITIYSYFLVSVLPFFFVNLSCIQLDLSLFGRLKADQCKVRELQ